MLKIILKNTFSNVAVLVIRIIITFVMSPIIVHSLGNYDYGIWEIVLAFLGYMGLLDLGLQPAIIKYVSQYNSVGDRNELEKIFSSCLALMSLSGFIGFLIFVIASFMLPDRMAQNAADHARYVQFFLLMGLQILIVFPGYVFQSFHYGLQRYYLTNMVFILVTVLGNIFLFILLKKGGGLNSLVLITALMAYAKNIIYWILLSLKKYGAYRFKIGNFSWGTFKQLVIFGIQIVFGGLARKVSDYIDTFVIAGFLGPIMVTFYAIPRNLIQTTFNIVPAITASFLPLFSELDTLKKQSATNNIFLYASRYILSIVFLFGIQIFFIGPPFLKIWMGIEYAQNGRLILYILILSRLFHISPLQARYLTATGKQLIFIKYSWYMATINLVVSLLLVNIWGIEGVALGTFIAVVSYYPFLFKRTLGFLGLRAVEYLRNVIIPIILPIIILIIIYCILSPIIMLDNYLSMLIIVIITTIIYVILFLFFSIKKDEKKIIQEKIRNSFLLNSFTKNNLKKI